MKELLSALFEQRLNSDRRRTFRGGRRYVDRVRAIALRGLFVGSTLCWSTAAHAAPLGFGTTMDSVKTAAAKGAPMTYGAFWVGAWTQKAGWSYAESELRLAKQLNVTPVINWWYWGDDISPSAVENGVEDRRQHVHKDKVAWTRMSNELADLINRIMGDRGAIVVLETEFNKNGIERYEPFDGYLADQIRIFHRKGNIKVALGFGNWGREQWHLFDAAVRESDLLGTQLLQSSVRDASTYMSAVNTLVSGAAFLHKTFGKPTMIVDLALSSYPAATYEERQKAMIAQLFERLPELKAAGVQGLIWRQLADDPSFDTSNYHGVAERYWGLLRADGSNKPALEPFIEGVRAERGNASAPLTAPQ